MNALVRPSGTSSKGPQGRFKRLMQPLVAPPVFDFWASRLNSTWAWDRPLARIVQRKAESADSLTSASKVDGCVSITVKAIEGGKFSQYLRDRAAVGDVLDLGPAFGDMTLPEAPSGRWLFLAAGSGITPLMSMVRALAEQGMPVPLTLIYWARTRAEFCFAEELRALATRHENFNLRFVLTRETAHSDDERAGRMSEDQLAALIDDLADRQVFACGPGGFVDTARALVAPRARLFQAEAFTPLPQAVHETGTVQVTLAASGRTLTLDRGISLLKALEDEGLRPASGCRMGICNTCSCGKSSGATRNLNTGELASEPASALKLCISSAVTDLVLDL